MSTKEQHLELGLLPVFSSQKYKQREKGNTLNKCSRIFILDPLVSPFLKFKSITCL